MQQKKGQKIRRLTYYCDIGGCFGPSFVQMGQNYVKLVWESMLTYSQVAL